MIRGEAFSVCCHYIILLNVKHASGRPVFVRKAARDAAPA